MTARHRARRARVSLFDLTLVLTYFAAAVTVTAAFLDWSIL